MSEQSPHYKSAVLQMALSRHKSISDAVNCAKENPDGCPHEQPKEPPTIKQMSGLIKDFTGGKSMKEYMEELSDE